MEIILIFWYLIFLYSFWLHAVPQLFTVVISWCGRFSRHGLCSRVSASCWPPSCCWRVFSLFWEWITPYETGLKNLRCLMNEKQRTDRSVPVSLKGLSDVYREWTWLYEDLAIMDNSPSRVKRFSLYYARLLSSMLENRGHYLQWRSP